MKRKARARDIVLGASIGVGLGLLLLAGIVLLARPYYRAALATPLPPPSDSPTTQPATASSAPPVAALETATPTSGVELPPTPTSQPEFITYTVQEADTLWYLAYEKFNTSIEAIRAASELTSNDIWPGDILTIPLSTVALPTPTLFAEGEAVVHTVVSGESLSVIGDKYGVSPEAIMTANDLTSEAIQTGQTLVIPMGEDRDRQPAADSQSPDRDWEPSVLQGDLQSSYPLALERERFTLHYQPHSLPADEIDVIATRVERALTHVENTLDVSLQGQLDVYVAGTLFEPPNLALRGRSFSSQRRFFFLHDGTGTPADQKYILTHELTHSTTWNTMGRPISVMLHEGVAVYAGMESVNDSGYIPIETFCAAYQQIGRLPSVSSSPSFQGHIRDLDTYYAAGCFVQHLIEQHGTGKFANVYHTGDYFGNYGKSLAELEGEWLAALASADVSFSFEPEALFSYVSRVAAGYDRLFTGFGGSAKDMEAYRELDRARMAVLEGRLDDAEVHLTRFDQALTGAG